MHMLKVKSNAPWVAGTGKSFISLYLALNQILTENNSYKRVVIVRSAAPLENKDLFLVIQK